MFNEINNPLPTSEYIIKAKEHIILESYGLREPCVLFDYVPSREVSDFLQIDDRRAESRRTSVEDKFAAEQMALALHHVHKNGYVHGDISPKNFLLDPSADRVHLIDFETLCPIDGDKMKRLWTNKDYMAPEVDQHGPKATSPASDVWSFGLVSSSGYCPQVWERDNLDEGWAKNSTGAKKSNKDTNCFNHWKYFAKRFGRGLALDTFSTGDFHSISSRHRGFNKTTEECQSWMIFRLVKIQLLPTRKRREHCED